MRKVSFIASLLLIALLIACSKQKQSIPNVNDTSHQNEIIIEDIHIEEYQKEVDIVREESIDKDEPALIDTQFEELKEKLYELPQGFVYLDEFIPHATYDIRYNSENNFVGEQIDGYLAPYAVGTVEMAEALVQVSTALYELGYTLLIYDTYRPAKAVSFLKEWALTDDIAMKEQYYPNEQKSELFKRGYLASKSGHSRGSTVDLTLVYRDTNELVDMGSDYDMLDEISSFNTNKITAEQANNRQVLKEMMVKHGFKEYSKEWWHYVLKNEPYPKTYFDFDIQ